MDQIVTIVIFTKTDEMLDELLPNFNEAVAEWAQTDSFDYSFLSSRSHLEVGAILKHSAKKMFDLWSMRHHEHMKQMKNALQLRVR